MDVGVVLQVNERLAGDEVLVDHTAGATTLFLSSVADFSDAGGQLTVNGATYVYSNRNDELQSIDISPGLVADIIAENSPLISPTPTGVNRWALVNTNQEEDSGWALIPQALYDRISLGVRDPDEQETVELEWLPSAARWVVKNVLDEAPSINGEFLLPGTTPDATVPDGEVPSGVVGLKGEPGVRSAHLSWTVVDNPNVTWYNVYGSASSPVIPSEDTFLGRADGPRFTASQVRGVDGMMALDAGMTGRFVVRAEDADGEGPPSSEVSVTPAQINSADLVVEAVTADRLGANSVRARNLEAVLALVTELQAGNIRINPTEGIVVPQTGSQAVTRLAADGTGNTFAGAGTFNDGLVSYGKVSMQGTDNFLSGNLKAGTGVGNPQQAPTVTTRYRTLTLSGKGYNRRGMCVANDAYVVADVLFGGTVSFYSRTTGESFGYFNILEGWQPWGGVTKVDNCYYVLCQQMSSISNWRVLIYRISDLAYLGSFSTNPLGGGSIDPDEDSRPIIGCNDAGQLVLLYVRPNGEIRLRRLNNYEQANAGQQTGNTLIITTGAPTTTYFGGARIIGSTLYIGYPTGVVAYSLSSTDGTRLPAEDFPRNGSALVGLWWNGTTWESFADGDLFTRHSSLSGTYDFAYDWYDNDPGGTGKATTAPSPRRTATPTRFADWLVNVPSAPPDDLTSDGANTARILVGPVGGTLISQGYLVTDGDGQTGKPIDLYGRLTSISTSGDPASATNQFANRPGAVGQFTSTAADGLGPIWSFAGDGGYRMGPYRGSPNLAQITSPVSLGTAASVPISGFYFNIVNVTIPNGSRTGVANNIPHGLGGTPVAVFAQTQGTAVGFYGRVSGRDATTISVQAERAGTSGDQTLPVMILAIR